MLSFIISPRPLIKPLAEQKSTRPLLGCWFVALFLFLASADAVYRIAGGISPQTKYRCLLYSSLPHWAFLVYENVIELMLLIVASVFISLLIERHLSRYARFLPTNPLSAFFYGAIIPICSCGILPMAARLRNRTGFSAMAALLVTGPLLSPQIIILSLTVAGPFYTISRIGATFIMAMTAGLVIGRLNPDFKGAENSTGCQKLCKNNNGGTLYDTWLIVKGILPSAILAGTLGILIESFKPLEHIASSGALSSPVGILAATLVGVPLYLCNGADIIFLKPLMTGGALPLGTALAFSLSSSSVCLASLVLMSYLLGKKIAILYLSHIVTGTLLIGMILNYLHL